MLKRASLRVRAAGAPSDPAAVSTVLIGRLRYLSALLKHFLGALDAISAAQTAAGKELGRLQSELGACAPPTAVAHTFLSSAHPASFRALCDSAQSSASAHGHRLTQLGKSTQSLSAEPLRGLRLKVKTAIAELESDLVRREHTLASCETALAEAVRNLALALETARTTPERVTALTDPLIINLAAQRTAYAAVDAANALHSSTLFFQRKSATLEEAIVGQLQSSFRAFASSMQLTPDDPLVRALGQLNAEAEWAHLASRPRALLADDAIPPSTTEVTYDGMHDDLALPLRRGALERKRRISRARNSCDYVLSHGFLHEYAIGMEGSEEPPRQSWYLPACSVGPPPDPAKKERTFSISGRLATSGLGKIKGVKIGAGDVSYEFTAATHPDAVAWHAALAEFTKTDLTSRVQQTFDRPGLERRSTALSDDWTDVAGAIGLIKTSDDSSSVWPGPVASAYATPPLSPALPDKDSSFKVVSRW